MGLESLDRPEKCSLHAWSRSMKLTEQVYADWDSNMDDSYETLWFYFTSKLPSSSTGTCVTVKLITYANLVLNKPRNVGKDSEIVNPDPIFRKWISHILLS